MANWRDEILTHFTPGASRVTVVADPDNLLLDEQVLQATGERGFEVISFEDPVAFRYDYESRYRARWDRGDATDLDLVARATSSNLNIFPYDVLQAGRTLRFGLTAFFPNLSYPVIATLDRGDLDALYQARATIGPIQLGDNATRDFVLRHVYRVDTSLIRDSSDLLTLLLRQHAQGRGVPLGFAERLVYLLRRESDFRDWPLEDIVLGRDAFLAFLQERWPIYLERLAKGTPNAIGEPAPSYALTYPGPAALPFDDATVRPLVGSLFLDGLLRPVETNDAQPVPAWALLGIRRDPEGDRRRRLRGLVDALENSVPSSDTRYPDWLAFAWRWAETTTLYDPSGIPIEPDLVSRFGQLRDRVDDAFLAWARNRYGGLYNQPAIPVMVHHIPRALASFRSENSGAKAALVVLDGLALDQWIVLRDVVLGQRGDFRFDEGAVFAWIPSITPVSRQAIFAGKTPAQFAGSIETTSREPVLWTQFWSDQGLSQSAIGYALLPPVDAHALAALDSLLSRPRLQVAGVVVGLVDQMAHGTPLGTAGVYQQVRLWARSGFLAALFHRLLDQKFSVFLTSDHGNLEATGIGRPSEGVIADTRGERVRVFPTISLRKHVQSRFPAATEWPPLGLPDSYLPLLASRRSAFVPSGDITVAHGGASVDEVVVPFVQVKRGKT
ncbi:MAG TPA: BREX-3 system phosphatase PglZ [Chloroflexota bacterium]|nr:BREX-3 system phosphatase PglZ [Chloroflexota bacterium]